MAMTAAERAQRWREAQKAKRENEIQSLKDIINTQHNQLQDNARIIQLLKDEAAGLYIKLQQEKLVAEMMKEQNKYLMAHLNKNK